MADDPFGPFRRKLQLLLNKAIDRNLLSEVGRTARDDIKRHTRLGNGVNDTGIQGKFIDLSDDYIEARQRMVSGRSRGAKKRKAGAERLRSTKKSKREILSRFTTPKKSNLTRTGQMLNALKYNIESLSLKQVSIDFKPNRRSSSLDNNELASFHQEGKGKLPRRPFMNLTIPERRKLERLVRKALLDEIKRLGLN